MSNVIHTICPIINVRLEATYRNGNEDPFIIPAGEAYEEKQRIMNDAFIWSVGTSGLSTILENPAFVFRKSSQFYAERFGITEYAAITRTLVPMFEEICNLLWLIKDHAISIVSACTYDIEFSSTIQSLINLHATNSSGEHDEILVTHGELDEAYHFKSIFPWSSRQRSGTQPLSNGVFVLSSGNYTDYTQSRMERAFDFVKRIRHSNYLPVKIIFYLALIESLTTIITERNSKTKVLLRVPDYLFNAQADRDRIREELTAAYNFRHKFAHGQLPVISEQNHPDRPYNFDDFKALSNSLDSIARNLFRKALTTDLSAFGGTDTDMSSLWSSLGLL